MSEERYEWYPGHMTKAVRMMRENLKLIDLVIEIADARIPEASRNPDIDAMCGGKARLLILNKADLSDPNGLRAWISYYRSQGLDTILLNATESGARGKLNAAIQKASEARRKRNKERGLINQPIRALVAGIPNVGKSTVINLLAGRTTAKTGNKPGVTRGKQWIQTGKMLQLMDTPGILWPRIGDRDAGEMLAIVGSMNDDNIVETALASGLIARLRDAAPEAVAKRYQLEPSDISGVSPEEVLQAIAKARGLLKPGGVTDTDRAAQVLIDDFRKGRLGGILLQRVTEQNGTEEEGSDE
ncbi:MAG: ribosome biogenesis GTPase YlqF [Lachnospiraceae bacterium]|nr:ribosome biogenesis GTPase YlqF [Lachnospiraceae bacterium]